MAKDANIKIDQLVLDAENPRIQSEAGQINIRQAVIDDQGSKIVELATDIVEFGLNPMDRLMVLQPDPAKKEFIALEGNRRTAALQLLAKPDLMNDLAIPDSFRSKMQDLAEDFDKKAVEPLKCVVMADRETARRWIELRHTGENDGRGIVGWNGVQTARFRGDKTLSILDMVEAHAGLTPDELDAVKKSFPITTLDRIVSNPNVRTQLGLQIIDGEFHSEYAGQEILPVLKRIVLDLAQKKINVTKVKTAEQQKQYVASLPKSLFPKAPKLPKPIHLDKLITPSPPPKPVPLSPSPPPPPPSPLSRKTLIPSGFGLHCSNQKACQIIYELRILNLDRYPVAGALLLRSLIEAAAGIYHDKHSLPKVHQAGRAAGKALTLQEKVIACVDHMQTNGIPKQKCTAAKNTLANPQSVISVQRLHEYTHNPADFPNRNDLLSSWSGIESFLIEALK